MKKSLQYHQKTITYRFSGHGPTLLLLHGFLESKAIWEDFTQILQKDFSILAIDLPGHGESDQLADTHGIKLMADAVLEVLKAENIETVVVAGHSMGGYVALQFASDHRDITKGLVLFHSHANADSAETKVNRQRTIQIVNQNRGGFIRQFIPDLFDQQLVGNYSIAIKELQDMAAVMTPGAIIAALQGMRDRTDQLHYLKSTSIPVLSILGKQDSRMPYANLISQAVLPSHSEILLLENVGHMGFIEAPGITVHAIKHFALRCFME